MHCTIWYHLYNFKNVKKTHVLLNPPWVFFTFLKLYKWYQIEQSITYFVKTIFLSSPVFTAFYILYLNQIFNFKIVK